VLGQFWNQDVANQEGVLRSLILDEFI
jgi:hypothetical protein